MKKRVFIILFSFFILLILILFVFQPIDSIKDINSTSDITILDAEDQPIMHLVNQHKTTPIELDQMNPKNIEILLFIEDKKFYQHSGFNLTRMGKAIISNFKNKTTQGASTITQQYIKNVYLNNKKTLTRKIKELYYAIKLEQSVSKDEILTAYLNCIYLGNDVYGIANASTYYFNKNYQDLTIGEMTTFVALLNAPTYYSNHLQELEKKKDSLLQHLYKNNVITTEEYDQAKGSIHFNYQKEIYSSNLLYFVDGVLNEFQTLNINPKFNQSITIHTRYHSKLNEPQFETNANYAYTALDKEGYIVSMVGDKNYYESSYNITVNGNRDIGSTIKPLLYYEALKCGFSTDTSYYSGPYSFNYHDETITIKNNASVYPYQNIKMKEAIATSDNIYAIKTHQALGFKTLVNHLKNYNIEAKPIPSLALGSVGMSLSKLVRIYTQFFTEGTYLKPLYIESVNLDNKKIYQAEPITKVLGIPKYFKEIKSLLNSVFDSHIPHATASSIGSLLKTTCYGKSGLTDYDSYMIGFNDDVLIGIWAGYLDNQKLTDSKTKRLPKEIFLKLMNQC